MKYEKVFNDKKYSFGKLFTFAYINYLLWQIFYLFASIHFWNVQKLGVNMIEVVKDGNSERF